MLRLKKSRKGLHGWKRGGLFLAGWIMVWAGSGHAEPARPFVGILAGQPVAMWLSESGEKVTGTYYYYKVGKSIALNGTRTSSGEYRLEEQVDGKVTGNLRVGPGGEAGFWQGTWSPPGGGKSFALDLMQVDRARQPSPRVTLLEGRDSLVRPRRFYSRPLAASWLKKHCLPFATGYVETVQSQCQVLQFEPFGEVGGERYYYALYRHITSFDSVWETGESIYDSPPYNQTALFWFAGPAEGPLTALYGETTDMGVAWFVPPQLVVTEYGTLLKMTNKISGTGAGQEHNLFRYKNGLWVAVDTDSFRTEIGKRLPKGYGIWKGFDIDLTTWQLELPVWKPDDVNCCPSGGKVKIRLTLKEDRLSVSDLEYPVK